MELRAFIMALEAVKELRKDDPIIVHTDVIICVILWFKPVLNVSTSFVIIDRTSPFVLLSKYFIGNLFILCVKSFLILYVIFCATPAII